MPSNTCTLYLQAAGECGSSSYVCTYFCQWMHFICCNLTLFDDACVQLKELYTLLNENYVEDDDNMFRFDYAPEFLLW